MITLNMEHNLRFAKTGTGCGLRMYSDLIRILAGDGVDIDFIWRDCVFYDRKMKHYCNTCLLSGYYAQSKNIKKGEQKSRRNEDE